MGSTHWYCDVCGKVLNKVSVGTHKCSERPEMRVSLVEHGVFNYPKGLEGWRLYRIEYGGHAEDCVYEGMIWLPQTMDPEVIEDLLSTNAENGFVAEK